MSNKINFDEEDLYNYYLTMLLINNLSKNQESITDKLNKPFLNRFKQYIKTKDNTELYDKMYDYAKLSVDYLRLQSAITMMYHLFEQFIKVFFNIDANKNYFDEASKIIKKYNYSFKDNSYFEIVNKYRLLNNAIKHGGIEDLENECPEFINNNCEPNKYGTMLDNSLNISNDNIDECCKGLCDFIDEMYSFFKDMGYIDE